jgi:hypothetical protein
MGAQLMLQSVCDACTQQGRQGLSGQYVRGNLKSWLIALC